MTLFNCNASATVGDEETLAAIHTWKLISGLLIPANHVNCPTADQNISFSEADNKSSLFPPDNTTLLILNAKLFWLMVMLKSEF